MTTLIGVFAGSVVSRRAQDRSWNRDQQVAACLRVLQESSVALTGLSVMEAHRPASAPQGMVVSTTVDWNPWNEAISLVNVVADRDIAEAAHALDEQLWRMHIKVRRGLTPDESWLDLQAGVTAARSHLIITARRRLSLAGDSLPRLSGRPAPDDPVWPTAHPGHPGNPGRV
ncbi:hypothetical protein [Streptomyces sp. NPDC059008]|uniref:hypothetical protein n=1 Tax=Streptomyces sp. NPDC059008 TaxID=3346693 RepID=UPI0036AC61EC